MAVFMVSYDLNAPGKDYTALLVAIREYECCHTLKSAFFIEANTTAGVIRDNLAQYLDANDALYVVRLQGNWAANRKLNCTDWLHAREGNF